MEHEKTRENRKKRGLQHEKSEVRTNIWSSLSKRKGHRKMGGLEHGG